MHARNITIFTIILLLIFTFYNKKLNAQQNGTGSIKGFIYEETGEPVAFTTVYLKKTTYGSTSNGNGFYVISNIHPGNYNLMVTTMGYDTINIPITIKGDEVITKKIILKKAAYNLNIVNIEASKEEARTETKISDFKVTPKQVKQIPTIGATPDLAQYLQVIPGVIFTGDQGGQLYIRGGSPIQNKVLLDGMVIYNPFHSIGLFSVFDTDILRNAEVYTGGFGAEYGGRISSIMDISTREGNNKRLSGKINASTFGAGIMIEGPLKKETEASPGSSTFIISAKNSYLAQSSKLFYSYIDSAGLPFNFNDIYAKLTFNGQNGNKINFFGFHYDDNVDNYKAISSFKWISNGFGTNFTVIPSGSTVLMDGIFAYSDYNITEISKDALPRNSDINGFNMALHFTYIMDKNQLKYGLELQGFKTDFNFYNSVKQAINQNDNTSEIAGYIKYKATIGKLLLEPSFRIQYYGSLSETSPEPRLAMKYLVSDKLRIKMAGGLYSQNLMDARSDLDIVNLFYGFLSSPDNLPAKFKGQVVNSRLQKSQHIILGAEYDIKDYITVNVEGYYKNFSQLTNINRNKVFPDDVPYSDPTSIYYRPDYLRTDYVIESGNAYGVDFSLKYDYKRIYVWAVYSLGFVNRSDELKDYVPSYDRRHNVNLLLSYILGSNFDWEIDLRWNYGSGFPYTQTQGFYEKLDFQQNISTDYLTTNGQLGVQYAGLNQGRLPDYHRLDFTLKKKFFVTKNSILETTLSITNVYDRQNIFYFDRVLNQRVDQLPFMPSVGCSLTF